MVRGHIVFMSRITVTVYELYTKIIIPLLSVIIHTEMFEKLSLPYSKKYPWSVNSGILLN